MSDQSEPNRYSHPAERPDDEPVLLETHLNDVAWRVECLISEKTKTSSDDPLAPVVRTIALVHDFGKATRWFQEYLDGTVPSPRALKDHAPLGALLAYYALDAQGFDDETCLAGFVTVWWHHNSLPDVVKAVFERTNTDLDEFAPRRETLQRQLRNIDGTVPVLAHKIVNDATDGDGTWTEFVEQVGSEQLYADICDQVSENVLTRQQKPDALPSTFYATLLQTWSPLVLADKTSAAGAPKDESIYEGTKPTFDRLDAHVERLQADATRDTAREDQLNDLRARARQQVLSEVERFAASDQGIARLTLPTGLGKTLTGLSAATKLRDETDRDRIVYALPFTSIIDQVVDEIRGIYDTDATDDLLTVHHHLADSSIERDDIDGPVQGMLGESWRAGVTVTTFVQLFESLAGPANAQSMKLPALRDSVVLLDEPQSLPHDWWKLVRRLGDVLVEQFDATVIAMTATPPRLFGDNTQELVAEPRTYFDALERVEYRLDDSVDRFVADEGKPLEYGTAAAELVDVVQNDDSVLAVCNTIDSARRLTDEVNTRLDSIDLGKVYASVINERGSVDGVTPKTLASRVVQRSNSPVVLHLSTRLRPVDRLTLIETAKRLLATDVSLLVVSTQLVEAGVDISFDHVYRDLAPVDSVVQAAGRCNRSFERECGTVTVWWLDVPDDQRHTPAVAVYDLFGTTLLPTAASVLRGVRNENDSIPEQAVAWDAVTDYYERLHQDKDIGREEYVDYVDEANAESLGRLSLIEQRRAVDVLVVRTDQEFEYVEQLREAWHHGAFERVRNLVAETQEFRVSVPVYDDESEEATVVSDLPPLYTTTDARVAHDDANVRVLDARTADRTEFDHTLGFVVPDPEDRLERRFL